MKLIALASLFLAALLGGSAEASTAVRLVAVAGGFDVLVDTDTQLDVVTVGIAAENGCVDCAFVWDNQRLIDRGLQDLEFLDPGPNGKTGLEKTGSFAVAPSPGIDLDFFTVQGTTLLGGAFGSREGPLNLPGETSFRLGSLLTEAPSAQLVAMEELVPVVGDLLIGEFPTVPDRDEDGVGNVADNCLFMANGLQEDTDANGIGNACECGDVDGDGFANVVDALLIARGEVGSAAPGFARCDVDGDGSCNTVDALLIARGELTPLDQFDQSCPAAVEP